MEWNHNTIIGYIVGALIIIIIIFVVVSKTRHGSSSDNGIKNGYVWIPLPPNSAPTSGQKAWDMSPYGRIFKPWNRTSKSGKKSADDVPSVEDYLGVMTFNNGEGFSTSIPIYSDFYEMCIYSYPDLTLLRTIPYPMDVNLRCPEDIMPGKYVIILRCRGNGSTEWSNEGFRGKCKVRESSITQFGKAVTIDDGSYHEKLGQEYQSIASMRQDIPTRNVISEQRPIFPASMFISRESMTLTLSPDEKAIVIFPNRVITAECQDSIFIDGTRMNIDSSNTFTSFEIDGANQETSSIDQVIYGNGSKEYLPFYAYIHSPA